jgi:DNA replication protein DnaC
VLLLDDLGKAKMTERSELELFDLLEHRSSHALPIFWTANAEKGALKQMLSPDRGEPILRRLSEFTKIIKT